MAVKWLNELFTIVILGPKEIILFKFYYSPNVEDSLRTSNLRLCAKLLVFMPKAHSKDS